MEWDSPAMTEPTTKADSVTTSIRSLPTMSPTRPRMGVKIEADSRNAVSTQVTVFWVVCRSCWMVGRTGETRDCSSEYAMAPSIRTAKVTL